MIIEHAEVTLLFVVTGLPTAESWGGVKGRKKVNTDDFCPFNTRAPLSKKVPPTYAMRKSRNLAIVNTPHQWMAYIKTLITERETLFYVRKFNTFYGKSPAGVLP